SESIFSTLFSLVYILWSIFSVLSSTSKIRTHQPHLAQSQHTSSPFRIFPANFACAFRQIIGRKVLYLYSRAGGPLRLHRRLRLLFLCLNQVHGLRPRIVRQRLRSIQSILIDFGSIRLVSMLLELRTVGQFPLFSALRQRPQNLSIWQWVQDLILLPFLRS